MLRKTGLDELPQLINVLKGDMSFVGPRPFSLSDLEIIKNEYPEIYNERVSFNTKPGITGLWQIEGNREEGIRNLIFLEKEYESKKSFLYDLSLVVKTIPVVFLANHSDAYIGGNFSSGSEKPNSKNISSRIKDTLLNKRVSQLIIDRGVK